MLSISKRLIKKSFVKKKNVFCLIRNDEVFFLYREKGWNLFKRIKIADAIDSEENLLKDLPKEISLLVVPDYWIGSSFYPIRSKKRSIVLSFISRKLTADFDFPEVKDFFEYIPYENGILVFFLQDENFYLLYKKLLSHLSFYKITCPAFLWQTKLRRNIKDIDKGGKAFIHLTPRYAYACFFSEGSLLFSREIDLEPENYLEQLSYEILQSLRLFSQKTKKDIEKIYLLSSEKEHPSLSLGIKTEWISKYIRSIPSECIEDLGTFAFMDEKDLSDTKLFYIPYRKEITFKEWETFQKIGLITGIIFLVLMTSEFFFLKKNFPEPGLVKDIKIQSYINEIDEFLKNRNRESFQKLLVNILNSSGDIYIKRLIIEPERIGIGGEIDSDVENLRKRIKGFLEKLSMSYPNIILPDFGEIKIEKKEKGRYEFYFELIKR